MKIRTLLGIEVSDLIPYETRRATSHEPRRELDIVRCRSIFALSTSTYAV